MKVDGAAFVILGALDAFPRRLAAREIRARGGELRRSLSRRTTFAVFGRQMLDGRAPAARIEAHIQAALGAGVLPLGENGFLHLLGLAEADATPRTLTERQLLDRSGLDRATFERLLLFDAFDSPSAPFGFRDLVSARQYSRLVAEGIEWVEIARAARARRLAEPEGGVSSVRLRRAGGEVLMQAGEGLSELSGQLVLAFAGEDPDSVDALFEAARQAEEEEDWARAAAIYRRCAEIDPQDADIAFNLSHALLKQGERQEARRHLTKTLRLDPAYAEAWYNLAAIAREENDFESARRHLRQAISADPGYPDPLYNLALLEFDAGDYEKAGALWERYRALDPDSVWGQKARYGLQLIGMMKAGAGAPPPEAPGGDADRRHLAG
jgi:tetratricopeptide (TPR) repeat protein